MLIFTKAEDKNPRLFPTIDAQLYAVSTQVYNKNYTFRMKVLSGEELVMAALSQDDYDSWIRALKKLKEETDRRKKALDKKHEI